MTDARSLTLKYVVLLTVEVCGCDNRFLILFLAQVSINGAALASWNSSGHDL